MSALAESYSKFNSDFRSRSSWIMKDVLSELGVFTRGSGTELAVLMLLGLRIWIDSLSISSYLIWTLSGLTRTRVFICDLVCSSVGVVPVWSLVWDSDMRFIAASGGLVGPERVTALVGRYCFLRLKLLSMKACRRSCCFVCKWADPNTLAAARYRWRSIFISFGFEFCNI